MPGKNNSKNVFSHGKIFIVYLFTQEEITKYKQENIQGVSTDMDMV